MTDFTPLHSLAGGAMIGLAAVLLMALHGRIAGFNGILSGVLPPVAADWPWRAAFLAGAVAGPFAYAALGFSVPFSIPVSTGMLLWGGLITGIGITFANGCPSGHGICGVARLSPRSIAAVITFMLTAFITVFIIRHVIGG